MRFTTKLLPSKTKNLGVLLLNNPKALHALTRDMVDCMSDVLQEWRKDSSGVKTILIKPSSKETKRPAFCVGGDVKSVYREGLEPKGGQPEDFFRHEYRLNYALATCKLPIVSLWDGLVIGGGVGISIHGKYRVATERTMFSMPECKIGLFPDVGSMWWMPRLFKRRSFANYVALTGYQLTSADLLYTGLATHYIPSSRLEDLEFALAEATNNSKKEGDLAASVLMSFHESIPIEACHLAQHKEEIENSFAAESVEEIVARLKESKTDFSLSTLAILERMSPKSLKVTMEGLKQGAKCKSIRDDLQMEYRMAKACVRPKMDFYEGIRAVLVDKDHSPQWKPATVEEVTNAMVDEFFVPIADEWTHDEKAESARL